MRIFHYLFCRAVSKTGTKRVLQSHNVLTKGGLPSYSATMKPQSLISGINMWPFVAVMFALVFLLMGFEIGLSGQRYNPAVDLPRASTATPQAKAQTEDALIVAVTRDGTVYFHGDKVRVDRLPARIRDELIKGSESKIYIHADSRARYGAVSEVLNKISTTSLR
jgi:biopolymer transport protein ExbD/biopolymer transport protein TolR